MKIGLASDVPETPVFDPCADSFPPGLRPGLAWPSDCFLRQTLKPSDVDEFAGRGQPRRHESSQPPDIRHAVDWRIFWSPALSTVNRCVPPCWV